MATIGRPEDIERVIPRGSQPIATIRNAGAIGAAVADLGTSIDQAARVAENYKLRKDRTELVTANSKFGIDRYKLLKEFEDRDGANGSYNKWGEEYQTNVDELLRERAKTISNSRLRTEFEESQQLSIAEGAGRLHDHVKKVETDFKLEDLNVQLDDWREAAINGDGRSAIFAIESMVERYELNGWLPENNQVAENFRQSAVKGWIESLPSNGEQVAALESELAKANMRTDVRKALLKVAKVGELAYVAEQITQKYIDDDMTFGEMIKDADDIEVGDKRIGKHFTKESLVKLKVEIRRQARNRETYRDHADLDTQSDLHLEYYQNIRRGKINPETGQPYKVSDILPADLEEMSIGLRNMLIAAEGQTGDRTVTRTPEAILDKLLQYQHAKDWTGMRKYILGYKESAPDTNGETVRKEQIQEQKDALFEKIKNVRQTYRLPSKGLTNDEMLDIESAVRWGLPTMPPDDRKRIERFIETTIRDKGKNYDEILVAIESVLTKADASIDDEEEAGVKTIEGVAQWMTASHADRFMSMAYDKSYNPDKRRSFFTTMEMIRSKLDKAKKKDGFSAMVDATGMWIDAIYENTGQEPTDKQVRDFVDTQLMIDYDWYNERVYELDAEELDKFYSENMTDEQKFQYMTTTRPFLYQKIRDLPDFEDASNQKILEAMEHSAANR